MPASRSFAAGGQWRVLTGAALNTTPPSPVFITSTQYTNNQLTVTLAAPINNGGSAITSYTVQAVPNGGGVTQTVTGAGTSHIVQSLIAGVTYSVRAYATNAVGDGALSTTQTFVVPAATFAKPLAYNTGYPHGLSGDTRTPQTLTTISGSDFETLIQSTAGDVTLSNYDVIGGFNLRRNNMTFQYCRFQGVPSTTSNSGFPYIAAGGSPQPSKVTFIDCEFAGNGVTQPDPGGDLTLGWAHSLPCNVGGQIHVRSHIWGFLDGFHAMDNARYEACYIHGLTYYHGPIEDTHNDGFQFVGGASDFAVIGCHFDVTGQGVNAVLQYNGGSSSQRITIANNWFNGGGYYSISGAPGPGDVIDIVFAHNRFGLNAGALEIWYPDDGWVDNLNAGHLTLIDNVWDASGTTSYGQVVTAGTLIPEPD